MKFFLPSDRLTVYSCIAASIRFSRHIQCGEINQLNFTLCPTAKSIPTLLSLSPTPTIPELTIFQNVRDVDGRKVNVRMRRQDPPAVEQVQLFDKEPIQILSVG